MPLFKMIKQLKPDIMVLKKTRADAISTFRKIWQGARCIQIFTIRDSADPKRAGVAIILRPGLESSLVGITNTNCSNKNELIQTVKVRLTRKVV